MAADAVLPRFAAEPEQLIAETVRMVEPQLTAEVIEAVLVATVKRRPERRRLAEVLDAAPDLLTSGRPEGPRSIERLITALLQHGALRLRPPECARCGAQKPLRALMNGLRICSYCKGRQIQRANPCVICGSRNYQGRDRDGRPRCRRHPPDEGRDPLDELSRNIAALSIGLSHSAAAAAIRSVERSRQGQLRLLWAWEDHPDLLTGGGAAGPPKTVPLIRALLDHGATGLIVPPCPFCRRAAELDMVLDSLRCCRICWRDARPQSCAQCGKSRYVAGRTLDGRPLCQNCNRADPLNLDLCSQCGTPGEVITRTEAGAVCRRCYQLPTATCVTCARTLPCLYADTDHPTCSTCASNAREHRPCSRCNTVRRMMYRSPEGEPLCKPCGAPKPTCSQCGQARRCHGRTLEGERLCKSCWRAHPVSQRACTDCESVVRLFHFGLCPPCAARRRLAAVLSGTRVAMRPELEPVFHALLQTSPTTLLRSLLADRPTHRLLTALAAGHGPVTHATLDRMTPVKAVQALRATLVAGGALSERDEHLATLEQWLSRTYARVPHADDRRLLRSFITWTQLRRLRRLSERRPTTYGQIIAVRHEVRNIVRLLEWLHQQGVRLAECTQDHLDAWLADGPAARCLVRVFLNWTSRRGYTRRLQTPLPSTDFSVNLLVPDQRWAMVRRLVGDEDLQAVDRAAGLLLLLFAQPTSRITLLTTDQVADHGDKVTLQLGRVPVELPAPLGDLVRQLVRRRKGHASPAGEGKWLFPGGQAGRPLAASHLNHRLKVIGIRPRLGRNTALMDIVSEVPSVVVSRLLGFHQNTADTWQRERPGFGPEYAAEVSRRRTTPD
ncbi:hypothetical protein [Streptomyces akebiae]|uniref:hypothetical protein n=1 Tax=Streptomyces akebiae TaxID=2865673 RepID=UPI002175F599|nr:hypothetical protein [Streptomyces akebiae]